jgi:hypothetical protein
MQYHTRGFDTLFIRPLQVAIIMPLQVIITLSLQKTIDKLQMFRIVIGFKIAR